MNLGISNIAWLPEEEPAVLELLRAQGIAHLEVAPSRRWPDPARATPAEARQWRAELAAHGLTITAFQAILFGKPALTLFHGDPPRQECAQYLAHIAALAGGCGAGPMVFGAPKNRRVPEGMPAPVADDIAVEFFRQLGPVAAANGAFFSLEPNPTGYDCNYLTHAADAARVVRRVNHPGVRLQIDAGELAMNGEDAAAAVSENADVIGHVHISQPMLAGFETPWPGHATLARSLDGIRYGGSISIEMKRPADGVAGLRRAIAFAKECYGAL